MAVVSPERNEFEWVVGANRYVLRVGMDALIELQEYFSTPEKLVEVEEIVRQIESGRLKYVRAAIWACLQSHHPGMSLEDASALVDQSDETTVRMLLRKLGMTTRPDAKDAAELMEGQSRPPKAQGRTRGTGGNSSSPVGRRG